MRDDTPGRDRPYMTVMQAAEYLDVSTMTVARWYDEGRLNGWRTTGGVRRIYRDEKARKARDEHHARLVAEAQKKAERRAPGG